jgi:hypothetical protein
MTWLAGRLRLDWVRPGSGVQGAYDVTGPDGDRLKGRFHAAWSAQGADCG